MLFKNLIRTLPPVLGMVIALAAVLPTQATIFEEFLFDDSIGTAIEAAVNNANPGNLFDVDADNTGVVTNGSGQLNASTKNNISFGTNYVDNVDITTGQVFGVMELTWDFQSVLDPAENEEIRITLINSAPRSTETTAEFRIVRDDSDNVIINGQANGAGSSDLSDVILNGGSLTQSTKFVAVVAADLDADTYEILYSSDAGASFLSAGTGNMNSTRGVASMRMGLNNDLVNDNILIDRVYLTDTSPITSIDALTLEVNTLTGNVQIRNDTTTLFDIDSYRIESPDPDHDLDFSGWDSLSDQAIDAIDGPDVGAIVGDGIGETWDQAAGSDNDVLAESFLLGSSVFGNGRSESLGSAFQIGGAQTLDFQYRDATTGALSDGTVVYVSTGPTADFDGDLDVDGADFLIWQKGLGLGGQVDNSNGDADGNGIVEHADLLEWEGQYGIGTLSASGNAASAVPEPLTSSLLALALATTILGSRKRLDL